MRGGLSRVRGMPPARPRADSVVMRPHAHPRPAPVSEGEDSRTSQEVRRFSLIWLGSALVVIIAVALASWIAAGFRNQADERARATTRAQLATGRLGGAIEHQAADRLAFNLTGAEPYFQAYQRDSATTRRLA